jgi:hypothetical protein
MLFTASTIKDSPANVRFFVEANLASGVDHMVVFLDAPGDPGQDEVRADLEAHPHVTCIPTRPKAWWAGDRPASLNVRQRINANWTRAVLEPFAWAEWLFHVDGDEVARLDRAAVAAVPPEATAVWLEPLEAVSRVTAQDRPTQFKRLLDDAELNLLAVLGTIDEPTNQAYFHGHVMGKAGVRPGSGLGLTLHDAVSPDGVRQEPHRDPRLRLLHYDAPSGEEFIRKWTALAHAGHARYRPSRAPAARALKMLVSRDLPEPVREKYLRRIYELTVLDDVEQLAELGLLEEVDPRRGGAAPRDFPPDGREAFSRRVDELRDGPKRHLLVTDARKDPDHRPAPGADGTGTVRGTARRLRRAGERLGDRVSGRD